MSHNKRCGDIISLRHALVGRLMYPTDPPSFLLMPVGQCEISSTVQGEMVTIQLTIPGVLDYCFTCKPVIEVHPEYTTAENVHHPRHTTLKLASSMGKEEYENLLTELEKAQIDVSLGRTKVQQAASPE